MVLGAQGVFFNDFFFSYLISPRVCHRFVGYLKEEVVITFTRAIIKIEKGELPAWSNLDAPEIAVQYWKMPEDQQKICDLLMYIHADEAKHRGVDHILANINQVADPKPYQAKYSDASKPHPSEGLRKLRETGWEKREFFR
ncbi:alternative oxidase-domain-containing protein [Aspergillus insuetus]